jgi:hypothetical protein
MGGNGGTNGLVGDDWTSVSRGGHAFPRRVLSLDLDGDEDVNHM